MADKTEFDFWLGEWECRDPSGALAGRNRIDKILKGRVLHEHWTGAGGSKGESFNVQASDTGRWHQTWVDDAGTLLLLDGGLDEAGSMVLEGTRPLPDGKQVLHRVRWTPRDDGSVQQTWTSTQDGGASWTTVVDLTYTHPADGGR